MRTPLKTLLFCGVFLALSSGAQANPGAKPTIWDWWPSHWRGLDFKPYLDDPKHSHNSQWDNTVWEPAHWTAQRGGNPMNVIARLYAADIIRGQHVDDDIPVLVVGPAFYMLSGEDKRRVAYMVNDAFQVTSQHENAMFMIEDWKEKPVGSFTLHGLQIQ